MALTFQNTRSGEWLELLLIGENTLSDYSLRVFFRKTAMIFHIWIPKTESSHNNDFPCDLRRSGQKMALRHQKTKKSPQIGRKIDLPAAISAPSKAILLNSPKFYIPVKDCFRHSPRHSEPMSSRKLALAGLPTDAGNVGGNNGFLV